jgi:peptide/nickel transport system permease protein
MAIFILRRVLFIIPTLIAISILSFAIIQLPPGDFLSSYAAQLRQEGDFVDEVELEALRQRYGLGEPVYVQYFKWMNGILTRGDWGQSFEWRRPVKDLIWERLGLTMVVAFSALLFSWVVAIPIGVYSATRQYSILDYSMTAISFIALGTPNFLIALVLLFVVQSQFGVNVSGLFSDEYIMAPWSLGKVMDMLSRLWVPLVIVAVSSTAGNIRITRANLLDELNKPYVETARAKGVSETKLIWKYPVRVALNPFFSTVGWSLATLISGETLVAIVLNLQTTGPMLLRALMSQDMYLAGSFLLMLSVLTVIGTLISDILLAIVDPRIRLEN